MGFPYFGGIATPHFTANEQQGDVSRARVPAVRLRLGSDGEYSEALVATVFDLQAAQYGIDRGLGSGAASYDDNAPYTPAWAEQITGVPRQQIIARWRANLPTTPTRHVANPWSSSARQ